jgi:hypothetical protein
MPATQASEATPSFGRLCAGMTADSQERLELIFIVRRTRHSGVEEHAG